MWGTWRRQDHQASWGTCNHQLGNPGYSLSLDSLWCIWENRVEAIMDGRLGKLFSRMSSGSIFEALPCTKHLPFAPFEKEEGKQPNTPSRPMQSNGNFSVLTNHAVAWFPRQDNGSKL